MPLLPIEQMMGRVDRHGGDSDTVLFTELLYAAEFLVRLTAAGMIALVQDDKEGHRYRLTHTLVRADGLGEWVGALDDVLTGPASQHLVAEAKMLRQILTERTTTGSWQYEACHRLRSILRELNPAAQELGAKASLREWYSTFSELRNKTRGHGAITPAFCAKYVNELRSNIFEIIQRFPLFSLPWAYLHRNLSGKYRVVALAGDQSVFSDLKKSATVNRNNYINGVYIWVDGLRRVELMHSDVDATDYYFPNGAFNGKRFELHSLITDNRLEGDAGPYLSVPNNRPSSETHGQGALEIRGNVLTNMPAPPEDYVSRPLLEREIGEVIANDRHPIITLVGRGGIGKTSLALRVLRTIANSDRFDLIVWFSARDIDLTTAGPKVVQPQVLTDKDIAAEYCSLIGNENEKLAVELMSNHLRASPEGRTLFVFDNFETVRSPVDLFNWIDTNVRLPNKVIITSRFREFKADYPVEITGMEKDEAAALIDQTAVRLGVTHLLNQNYKEQLIEEADGHPYVIKIILGELATTGVLSKPKALIARKDDILAGC